MAECLKCGAILAGTEIEVGVCYPCERKMSQAEIANLKAGATERIRQEAIRVAREKEESITKAETDKAESLAASESAEKYKAAMILTTETYPSGLEISNRLQIVTAECVFGMNMVKDFFAEVTDLIGGRSNTTQKLFRTARETVLQELRQEAYLVGANAVIAVNLQYSQLTGKGASMLMVVATGTAVNLSVNK